MQSVRDYIDTLDHDDVVVSGDARGVDRVAFGQARYIGLEARAFPADWSKGLGAGYARNAEMIKTVDRVVAFWDERSRGTKHAMDYALKIGKPATWYGADGRPRGAWTGRP